jgi:hypothetical protein
LHQSFEKSCACLNVLIRIERVAYAVFVRGARHQLHQAHGSFVGDAAGPETGFLLNDGCYQVGGHSGFAGGGLDQDLLANEGKDRAGAAVDYLVDYEEAAIHDRCEFELAADGVLLFLD